MHLADDENEFVLTLFNNNNNRSKWSKPLNLIAPTTASQNPISQSPTTSSSSSSRSSMTNLVVTVYTRHTLLEAASAFSESKNDAALEILSRGVFQPPPNATPEQKLVGFLNQGFVSNNPSPN